jgi:hypothetical protein
MFLSLAQAAARCAQRSLCFGHSDSLRMRHVEITLTWAGVASGKQATRSTRQRGLFSFSKRPATWDITPEVRMRNNWTIVLAKLSRQSISQARDDHGQELADLPIEPWLLL